MAEAAKILGTRHIGSLIVMQFWTTVAIVTERDLLSKVLACGLDLYDTGKRGHDLSAHQDMPDTGDQEAARTMIHEKGGSLPSNAMKSPGSFTASDLIREMPDAPET